MSKNIIKNNFMLEALDQARIALKFDEVPVGAVIVENNQIIASGFNQNRQKFDPTLHAEIVALMKNLARLKAIQFFLELKTRILKVNFTQELVPKIPRRCFRIFLKINVKLLFYIFK